LHLRSRSQRLINVLALSLLSEAARFGLPPVMPGRGLTIVTCLRASSLAPFGSTMSGRQSFPVSIRRTAEAKEASSLSLPGQTTVDRELMERVVAGDEIAFTVLYRRLSPGLFSMIYQILQDQKESEDVLQEAFVQMWKKSSSYDPGRSALFTWAVMISRNKAIDRLRGRQRRTRLVEDATAELSAAPRDFETGADVLSGESDERKRIRGALSALPAPQREAIELAFFSDMTQAEVSAKLSEPLGTIKARIRRGLLTLRDLLQSSP
jgi:RNA polymerase sigma-70 factor (ECF subfamily)